MIVSGNVGIGNNNPNSTLQITGSISVNTISTNSTYTLTNTDYCVIFTGTSNGQTFTLPASLEVGGRVVVIVNQSNKPLTTTQYQSGSGGANTTSILAGVNAMLVYDASVGVWRKIN
jgi:hypothetical protein